jgi:conjugal transfer mating pair stabilization protein TraG
MEGAIYTYGGGEVLWKVFNGIAMLFQSESPYFTSIGKLTIGFSLLMVAIRAIPQASLLIFFKSWFLPTTLLVALFYGPKTNVHIIDEIDTNAKYEKVDHIPLGIATVASFTSTLSKHLTELTEKIFTTSDAERFSKVGPMFASQMIHQAQQLTIKDPLMRENMKDFVRQCYAWPYVFSNLEPGKKAALETDNIFGFIQENPHPLLGVYWRSSDGKTEFKNCNDCINVVKEALEVEVKSGIKSLGEKLFYAAKDEEAPSKRLQQYFGDAWASIAKGSSNVANTIQQELLINAYREAIQDKRDELGLGRTDTSLLQLNAARGQAYQNNSFLVKAAMAGGQIVTLHGLFFALSLIFFALVAPLTFLPQGLRLLTTWLKVMAWLATWPVVMTVLNMLGHMYAAKSVASELVGLGSGLTVLTQSGMSEASYNAYCWIMGLQLSVPFLSWALISGGGYAFSQMASSLTQSSEGFASKAGSEIVDGNVSFDTQSIGNRSIANIQIAQQQLSPSFNSGMRFDDGKIAALHGPNGQVTIQEHQTQLGTNVSRSDAANIVSGIQSAMELQSSRQLSRMAGEQTQMGMNELFSFSKSIAENKGMNETFGDSELVNSQKQIQDAMDTVNRFAEDHGYDKQKAFEAMVQAGINVSGDSFTKGGSLFNRVAGILSIGANGNFKGSANDREAISKAESSGLSKQFMENLSSGIQYMEDHKGSLGKHFNTQSLDQAQQHFNSSKNFSEQASASYQESQRLSETASSQRQQSVSATRNVNDDVLSQIAQERFGGNKAEAAKYASENPDSYQREVTGFLDARQSAMQPSSLLSKDDIRQHHAQMDQRIEQKPMTNQELDTMRNNYNLTKQEHQLNQDLAGYRQTTRQDIDQQTSKISNEEIQQQIKEQEKAFQKEGNKYLAKKAWDKTWE